MEEVTHRLDNYKAKHHKLLKEATALLELDGNDEDEVAAKEGQRQIEREEMRVTSGANIVIKNVLPFLVLKS